MKHLLLFTIGIVGLVATVFALRAGSGQGEKRVDYYASGQVQIECQLRDGVRDGECRRFWPDGKLLAEGRYEDGLMSGPWTFWNADGAPDEARSGNYVAGDYAGAEK